MKRTLIAALVVGMLVLLCVPASVVAARSTESEPIRCVEDIAANQWDLPQSDEVYWRGPVSGCGIEGTVTFHEHWDENYVVGTTEHFFETFTFWPTSGGYITGTDAGVWNFATFKFRANGWVTETSPEWASLLGYKFQEMGKTSDPNAGLPITGYGTTMMLAPP